MSRPTEGLQRTLVETLNQYMDEQGIAVLQDPLRLEGWLRDVLPEHRGAVSCVMEGLHTEICDATGSIQDVAALLSLRAGLTPAWADFSVRVWRAVLKNRQMHHSTESVPSTESENHVQTVDAVLSHYRK
jgi:hypothetical protein